MPAAAVPRFALRCPAITALHGRATRSVVRAAYVRISSTTGIVRVVLEGAVLVIGFLLGGHVGLGTVVFAALIGPSVEASFWLISLTPAVR